jgi:hypothetical protein
LEFSRGVIGESLDQRFTDGSVEHIGKRPKFKTQSEHLVYRVEYLIPIPPDGVIFRTVRPELVEG